MEWDKELIEEILKYVEEVEEQLEWERGRGRTFEELLNDHNEKHKLIPDFYFKLKAMIDNN